MISDFVKGKAKFSYPSGIQHGITLHRFIDAFTDGHAATKAAKEVFRPHYRLYSGALVDVVYDHFLATDTREFSDSALSEFSLYTYSVLEEHSALLPERFARMFPYMTQHNWLYNYRTRWGTERSLEGLVRRAAYLTDSHTAFLLFEQHYQLLQDCFRHFWAEAKPCAEAQLYMITRGADENT